jgi:hypothetical protein
MQKVFASFFGKKEGESNMARAFGSFPGRKE